MENRQNWLVEVMEMIAPGSLLRDGLENILRAKTGALLVISNSEEVLGIVDGGFNINAELTPSRLYELAKMDGAIVLSSDAERILCANAQLIPEPSISSAETGTRHRTAERVARQTGELVIAISQRRDIISLYKEDKKHVLQDIRVVIAEANQAVQTLDKYRSVLDQALTNLSALEFEDLVTIADVVTVIQRCERVLKIQKEIERYIGELGNEGRLIKMQLEELVTNVEQEAVLLIKDYIVEEKETAPEELLEEIIEWSSDEMLGMNTISKALGHGGQVNSLDLSITPRGYRLLRKVPRLPMPVIENLVSHFENLNGILNSSQDELDEVDGVGEVRAQAIKEGLRRLRDQVLLDRQI